MRIKKKDLLRFLLGEEITAKYSRKEIQGIFTFGYWKDGEFVEEINPSKSPKIKGIRKRGYHIRLSQKLNNLILPIKSKSVNYRKSSFEERTLILENN